MLTKKFYDDKNKAKIASWILLILQTLECLASTETGEQICSTRMQPCDPSERNATCYWEIQKCDGETDCPNNNDEMNCPYRIPCNTVYGKEGYLCDNGECTLKYWFCDGNEDCADGSDERLCNSTILEQGVSDIVHKQLLAATCNHWVYYQCGFKYPSDYLKWKTWDELKGYEWTKEDFDSICSHVAATIRCVSQNVPQCFGFEEGLVFYEHVYNILCQPPNITFAKALLPCFNDASTQIAIMYYKNLTQQWDFYGPGSKDEPKEDVKYSICIHNYVTFESRILEMIDQNCNRVWTSLIAKGLAYRIKEPVIRKYGNFDKPFCNARIYLEDQWDTYINPVLSLTDNQREKLRRGQLP